MPERSDELREWQKELAEEGIPFYFVTDAVEAARLLAKHRMVKKSVIAEVEDERAAQLST